MIKFLPFLYILANGLNMVRLAFQRSNFSILHYIYLLLSSLFLALSAKCTIFFVGKCYSITIFLISKLLLFSIFKMYSPL